MSDPGGGNLKLVTENKTVVLPSPLAPEDEFLTFLHYFHSGLAEFGLGEAIFKAAALRGIKVRVIKRDIRLDGIDLLADEPFATDLLAASDGRFDGFHSGFPCSTFSCTRFLPGGPPPVRERQHLRGRPSNSRAQQLEAEKETCSLCDLQSWYVPSSLERRSGGC